MDKADTRIADLTSNGSNWELILTDGPQGPILWVSHAGGRSGCSIGDPIRGRANLRLVFTHRPDEPPPGSEWGLLVESKGAVVDARLVSSGYEVQLPHRTPFRQSVFISHVFPGTQPPDAYVLVRLLDPGETLRLDLPTVPQEQWDEVRRIEQFSYPRLSLDQRRADATSLLDPSSGWGPVLRVTASDQPGWSYDININEFTAVSFGDLVAATVKLLRKDSRVTDVRLEKRDVILVATVDIHRSTLEDRLLSWWNEQLQEFKAT